MNERTGLVGLRRRMARYAVITGYFQGFLGLGVLCTMFGMGPLVLLFLIPMTNIAYPWLMRSGISMQLWPMAMVIGTVFMFFTISAIGEFAYWLRRLIRESVRKE
jgi:nitrate reductase gamma subunit